MVFIMVIWLIVDGSLGITVRNIQYTKFYQDKNVKDMVHDTRPIKSLHSVSVTRCIDACLREHECRSVFFRNDKRACLMYRSRMAAVSSVIHENGWRFYHMNHDMCKTSLGYMYDKNLDRCIKAYSNLMTIEKAAYACQEENASLVKIDSHLMQLFVQHVIDDMDATYFYIQGTKDKSGVWRYDDSTEITYLSWGRKQPDNETTHVHLLLWESDESQFHDVSGSMNYGYICEINLK